MNTVKTKEGEKRLREFDALRGVSMLLVVYAHVLLGFNSSECITGEFFTTFRMPLFFFVSGFFAYRKYCTWIRPFYKRVFVQKIKAQIICTIVFYALLRFTWDLDPFGWIDKGFQGYWFTIVLFQMFSIYAIFNVIAHLIHRDIAVNMMIICSIILMALIPLGAIKDKQIFVILNTGNLCYFTQWFSLGLLVRQFENRFIILIANNYVKAFLIIGFVCGLCALHTEVQMSDMVKRGLSVLISYLGLLTIISLFNNFKGFFNSNNRLSNSLCFVGRRTLDIYMLHYFFLPSMPSFAYWIAPNSMVIMQICIGMSFAVIITAICLIISSCLRSSAFLSEWLFGVRKRIQPQC